MSKKTKDLLQKRLQGEKKEKISALVRRSTSGELSSFSGIFQPYSVSEEEKEKLKGLLHTYTEKKTDLLADLEELVQITSEVKAITSQAVILHGERLKKVQTLLLHYREGAFTAYLIQIYGNRQTPYNFLLYYQLYSQSSEEHRRILTKMPRQVVYTLSSRKISQKEKEAFISSYKGETKQELLEKLRKIFPLSFTDKRRPDSAEKAYRLVKEAQNYLMDHLPLFNEREKERIKKMLISLNALFS